MANTPKYLKVNRLADIIVVTTLLVLAAVASIVLTSSYRKLWRSVLKNGSALGVIQAATKEYAPIVEKPTEAVQVVETFQAPLEESRPTQDSISTVPVATLTNVQEKPLDTPFNIEQPAPIVVIEATQQTASPEETKETPQTTRGARRKKSAARTRSTKRSRKKVSEAQPSTESQPPS